MDTNLIRIVELLREAHLAAISEIERLNLRIAELEIQNRAIIEPPAARNPATLPAPVSKTPVVKPLSASTESEPGLLNEHEVASYLKISVATVRRWRLLRQGPKFLKIGSAVRYRREEVEKWLDSCSGLK